MENVFNILLMLHIVGGGIGLITGTINSVRPKGDRIHKIVGLFFLYGMLTAGICSLFLSLIHPNYLLFVVGVFTIYLTATAYRYLSLKQLANGQKAKLIDWLLVVFMSVFAAVFIGLGIYSLVKSNTFGIALIVFGIISARMVMGDIKNYRGKTQFKNTWLLVHLQRMIGAYIAAITAFLVVNVPSGILPNNIAFVPWLLPSVILVPLILKWTKKYQVKKAG